MGSSTYPSRPATFNGTSQYAGDLQQAITQAVTIASIPMTELENNVTTLQSAVERADHATDATSRPFRPPFRTFFGATAAADWRHGFRYDRRVRDGGFVCGRTAGTYHVERDQPGSPTTTLSNAGFHGGGSDCDFDQHFRQLHADA